MRNRAQSGALSSQDNVEWINAAGQGGVVLVCEHASDFLPEEFSGLGLDDNALKSHIAWDLGALDVAKGLSELLDAPLVAPVVSRLIYDCNRPVLAQTAVPEQSEIYDIPGNIGLSKSDRQVRSKRFYQPYRKALVSSIEGFLQDGRMPVIVTIHSFTPVYKSKQRDLDLGVLHDTDTRLADQVLALVEREGELTVRRNEPYGPDDGVTYTLAEHAVSRGLLNVMFEIRNDLIIDANGQQAMAKRLAGYLQGALAVLDVNLTCEVSS